MRVPPFYERPTVKRFFAGIIIGVIIGWVFFIYQYGQVYEGLVFRISEQKAEIEELEEDIELLRSEQNRLNEENEKKLTVQEIDIQFSNNNRLRLNQLTLLDIKQQALTELQYIKRRDIETVSNMNELLISNLENKVFRAGDKRYQLQVEQVHLFTTVRVIVKIIPSNS
ncbi:hypothetical protein JCM9140_4298 [Halalkalibacter wakoensis JCM 9140]|uniref:Sporulation membrane protein YtrI C-terminal domain-containing protein n=1 Tax=Halalkalibacter wakoensis JCM 9140 TaxID=1236970 RepID=W4Q9N9_9BACI|nr:sporulation membrane protein YtrI [Halalkalibacter wakoensis]GAE28104.1 hypothetical protein JCM9140_4298 [Halalkalibacter wakoensis JCM 9140]